MLRFSAPSGVARWLVRGTCAAACALVSPFAAAHSAARAVVVECGLERMLAKVERDLAAEARRTVPWLTDEQSARVRRALDHLVDARVLAAAVESALSSGVSASHLASYRAWCASPLGRRVIQLQSAHQPDLFDPEFVRFASQLRRQAPSSSRLSSIIQIVEAGDTIDGTVRLAAAAAVAMASVVGTVSRSWTREKEESLRSLFEGRHAQSVRAGVREILVATVAFVLRDLSDREVREVAAFSASGAAVAVEGVSLAAIARTVASRTAESVRLASAPLAGSVPSPQRDSPSRQRNGEPSYF